MPLGPVPVRQREDDDATKSPMGRRLRQEEVQALGAAGDVHRRRPHVAAVLQRVLQLLSERCPERAHA
eukprot:9080888-Pyramimonas_sp.AAC.1